VDPFVLQLAELCTTHRTRAKWVFVPAHSVGRTLGDRLALEGTDWVNLRFVTPLDIALRMGAPFLVERGIDPSEEGLGPALIMRLLIDLPRQGGYFRSLADQPTMAQALWATIRELRMAGVHAVDLTGQAFASSSKHAELRALLAAYERHLITQSQGDMATVYMEAVDHPDWCPVQPQDLWTELPNALWAPLQRRLLNMMAGERVIPRALQLAGAKLPRRFESNAAEFVAADPNTSPMAFLLKPADASSRRTGNALRLFHAGGREAEIDEVFRRILASGRSLDQVEISCASGPYAELVWEKACRHEWPVTIGPGLPVTSTRPGRALLAFCAWIEGDFTAGVLRRMLQSGDLALNGIENLTPGQAARILYRAQAAWGRATYSNSLTRLLHVYRRKSTDPDRSDREREAAVVKALRTERLLTWIGELLASVPQGGEGIPIKLEDAVNSALKFLDACAAKANALDGAAVAALKESIARLKALASFECPLAAGLRFIRERIEGLRVGIDRPRPGHLHVSALAQCGFSNRACVFIVGLEEGRVFPPAVEDSVLLDSERERINPALRRSSDRIDESVYGTLSRIAVAGVSRDSELCLSYSCRDLREYRETFPSWLMLQAFRVQSGDPYASYPDLAKALGAPKSWVPESPAAAASDASWWLANLKMAPGKGREAVLREVPALSKGCRAKDARAGTTFTEFDGYVPDAGRALDPCAVEQVLSVTTLEAAAGCAFRHFLKHGLQLDAVEERERDPDVWLDPMIRGQELHDLYAAMLRLCRDQKRRPNSQKDLAWLHDRARARLDALRVEMPPPSREVFEREVRDVLGDLTLFLTAECDTEQERMAIGLEVSFGRTLDAKEGTIEPLARVDPLIIDLGKGLRLRLAGRIDRIDQIGPDQFEVIDYKTGWFSEAQWRGTFAGGKRLQHALYGLAAAELLRSRYKSPSIEASEYYFPSARGGQERRRLNGSSLSSVASVLGDLRDVIASGAFVHAPEKDPCRYCDFENACGGASERTSGKLPDSRLAPYRRLVGHE
jgi:hypothetical protein